MDEEAKAIQETAKAAQEVAKAAPAVIEAGTELARWVGSVLGTIPEDIVGLTFGDYLKELRTRNLDRLRGKTEDILRQRGIEQPEPIDPKVAIPAFEAASMESNEELQDLWANLLANAMDPTMDVSLRQIFIDTLKQFEPIDALVLNALVKISESSGKRSFSGTACYELNLRAAQIALSMQNLEKLGCVMRAGGASKSGTDAYMEGQFSLTPLGDEFFIACQPLLERATEIGQGPQCDQVDADQRLDAGNDPDPSCGSQGELLGLHAGDPVANVEVTPAYVDGREKTEIQAPQWHTVTCNQKRFRFSLPLLL